MTTLSKLVDPSIFVAVESLLQHAQKDDVAFLALIILTGIFYNLYLKEKPDPYHHVWFERPQAADANAKGADTRDIGVKLEESKKDLVIFWGSQSGTAGGFANRLVRDCRSRFGLDALAADLSDYDPESIANIPETKLAIFIISTYGEGDPSDNATQFLSWLDSNKVVQFSKLSYAAFGLGNKKYKFYNRVVDVVVEALDRSGAKSLMPVGKADDSNGATEEDFTEWKQSLFSLFRGTLGFAERPTQYEPTLRVVEDTSLDIIDLHIGEPIKSKTTKKGSALASPIQPLPVKTAKKLLSTQERNCLHLELDLNEFPELKYKTGDHLAVWPSNPTSEINLLVTALRLQEKKEVPLLIQALDPAVQVKVPSPTTWSALLHYYLEISGPVPRETVLALSNFAPSPSSKATFKHLGENKEAYHDYCENNHVTLGRLLNFLEPREGAWSEVPLSFVLESLPTLSPRYYSISSSSIVSPKTVSITVATSSSSSHSSTPIQIPGLTTEYLLSLQQSHQGALPPPESDFALSGPNNILSSPTNPEQLKLFSQIRPSKFRLPTVPKHPIILIASGSGLAPFLGFLTERARLTSIGRDVGKSLLFFGCRGPSDYIYQNELESLVDGSKGGIEAITAFSRTGGKKVYVQDKLESREEEVVRMLVEENAYLYICGSAGMARDVAARLGGILQRRMGWEEEGVREWSEGVRRGRRWQEDVWG